MVGCTSDGISNMMQTRWLLRSTKRGLREFDLARNPGLNNTTGYGAGEFRLSTLLITRMEGPMSNKLASMTRSQQAEEEYLDTARLKSGLERAQSELDQVIPERYQQRAELEQVGKLLEET